jgi:hypothetical protein
VNFSSFADEVAEAAKLAASVGIDKFFVQNTTSDAAAKEQTQKENAARPAVVEMTYESTGVGQQRVSKPLFFGIAFRNEPHFTTGSATVKNPDSKHWHDPIGQAGVRTWERDSRGLYVGAHIWVRTDMYPIDPTNGDLPPAKTTTLHYLTFTGTGIKSITNPKSNTLTTRTPGIA